MDVLTFLGLAMGLGVVYYVMLQGQITALLINLNAFLLVFGGTFASTLITYPWNVIKRVPKAMMFVFKPPKQRSISDLIDRLVQMQTNVFSNGIDSLSNEIERIDDKFIRSGIRMLLEDQDAGTIEDNMNNELIATRQRHHRVSGVFRSMGSYSPIFGLLGTLIGVVQVLRNLSDPSAMGSAMAIAITTTFYGIFGCNFIFLPVAGKLEGYSSDELLKKDLIINGIVAIKKKTLPSVMRRQLERYYSEKYRKSA